jgi:K+-transporting ATPase A subunit
LVGYRSACCTARLSPGIAGIDQTPSPLRAGANMEGKEVRFGILGSALFAEASTAFSDGAA